MDTTKKLPDKPSELILLALADLKKCEADPKYKIDMGEWLDSCQGVCYVCLAGSVMAKSMGVTVSGVPDDFDDDTCVKLKALNLFRGGFVQRGLDTMHLSIVYGGEEEPSPYCINPEQFHTDMQAMAARLKEVGL